MLWVVDTTFLMIKFEEAEIFSKVKSQRDFPPHFPFICIFFPSSLMILYSNSSLTRPLKSWRLRHDSHWERKITECNTSRTEFTVCPLFHLFTLTHLWTLFCPWPIWINKLCCSLYLQYHIWYVDLTEFLSNLRLTPVHGGFRRNNVSL